MFYVYILQSEKDKKFYVGYSEDLEMRLRLHNNGRIKSTKNRRPFKSIMKHVLMKKTLCIEKNI